MRSFPQPDARIRAVAAALAALTPLVTLIVWRPDGIVSVVLALLCVLFAMITGTALTVARQRDAQEPAGGSTAPGQPTAGPYGVDADTLEALDSRAVQERRLRVDRFSDR